MAFSIQVWCTPQGRNGISLLPGTFSKPCEYVGRSGHVYYGIVSLNVEIQHFSISVDVGNGRLGVRKFDKFVIRGLY